ncbi:type ISP restriction/modification enzyme [Moheibacter stercoris]|uniref:site-specific DNA-methyltransferase (adenine-specific) n=1 Tax=Moheibacter stercoris TaxID=1628251 RepID=A0ABV2LV08_9FLAO
MTTQQYIDNLNQRFKLGNATEHTFRGDLQALVEHLLPGIQATNEPKRQACGAPDYILTQNKIEKGYIEAKDIGDKDLEGAKKTGNKLQFDRYKQALPNLLITDYLRFRLYREGEFVTEVKIGEVDGNRIVPIVGNFSHFENLVKDFASYKGQTIKSPKKLAEMMAGKARLLSDVIENALNSDEINYENSTLKDQKLAFKQILIHDITPKGFADVYAQTIAYGMFAARLHDPTLPTFSRQEAAELIPKSNPFLRKLFGYIAGPDIDDRILWIVDSLVEIFLACNVEEILKNYGKATKMEDPIIHFYETFLSEYDPKLRKARGVWYTPAPVVNFIVRAVDEVLKTEFGLNQGLADTSKTTIKLNTQIADKRSATGYKQEEREVHRVQILDPATGTGTFLAEVVKHIYKKFEGQEGIWTNYVEQHLLPRLNGFELLMASYAMAHLQMDLLLKETGFKPMSNQRLRVYLTNSLEESHPDTGTLFANWLSTEANEANHIKTNTPVMCIIGNPPYSGISSNNGEWIASLIEDYKYVDGVHFNERKHWLNDDYVKFLRYGQHYIEKNGSGVLAYINPHGFLDNPTFRGMRWNLLKTYDKIYTIDLHGNSKKKETAPDGGIDQNVFDIQQGVSINIFVKTGEKKENELGKVFHYDLYGKREDKYDFLVNNSLNKIGFNEIEYSEPYYFFVPKDENGRIEYEEGIRISELFQNNSVGFVSANDNLNISMSSEEQREKIKDILNLEENIWRNKYNRLKDARDWQYNFAKNDAFNNQNNSLTNVTYRPFDIRFTLYTGNSRGLYSSPQPKTLLHFLNNKKNVGLVIGRQGQVVGSMPWNLAFITNSVTDFNLFYRGGGMIYPLYLYPERTEQQSLEGKVERVPNLNMEIVREIEKSLGIDFVAEREEGNLCFAENVDELQDAYKASFAPIDLLDYIYAVLHSPAYREKYKEFLKIDFPRVPHPSDVSVFWQLVKLGGKLRRIHLLESEQVERYVTKYPIGGDNVVDKPLYKDGKVYINETQYFEGVPEVAWNFYIGGYQPAQKWLKDRKGRALEFDDILHYQKIIVALMETDRLMKEIDMVGVVD